jgi:hypothetical protein
MLAYLDALLDALSVRDTADVERLLSHPLARVLPETVRDEARALIQRTGDGLAAPLRLMRLRHVTAELLQDAPVIADLADAPDAVADDVVADAPREPRRAGPTLTRRAPRQVQMELPLSA